MSQYRYQATVVDGVCVIGPMAEWKNSYHWIGVGPADFMSIAGNYPMICLCGLQEVQHLLQLVQDDINPQKIVQATLQDLPSLSRQFLLGWSDRILTS